MTTLKVGQVHELPPSTLFADAMQPRDPNSINKAALKELSASVKKHGVLQPIVVRVARKKVVIIFGERRWRAAKLAKLKTVPCILGKKGDVFDRAAQQLAENFDREDLNPVDVAAFLLRLLKQQKKSVNELVGELAKRGIEEVSHARVEKLLQINRLPAWAIKMLGNRTMTEKQAIRLLPILKFPKVMAELKQQLTRSVVWAGLLSDKEFPQDLKNAHRRVGRDLKQSWGSEQRLFQLKVCDGCEFRVKVGANGLYCMDPKAFDQKNKDWSTAKKERDARKLAKGKATATPQISPAEKKVKAKRKAELIETKLSTWLDGWLRRRVLACIADRATGAQIHALTYWLATGAVNQAKSWSAGQNLEAVGRETSGLLHAAKIGDLQAALGYAMCADHKAEREDGIGRAAVSVMNEEQLRWFARVVLKFDLLKEGFAIDIAFLDLHRKPQLIDFAQAGGVVPRGAGGVPLLKQDILSTKGSVKKIAVPKGISDLFDRDPKPIPDKVFATAQPTSHDQLIHELGLDSSATMDEVVHALHVQSEETAAKAAAEATKTIEAKQKVVAKKKAAKKKPARKKAKKKRVAAEMHLPVEVAKQ